MLPRIHARPHPKLLESPRLAQRGILTARPQARSSSSSISAAATSGSGTRGDSLAHPCIGAGFAGLAGVRGGLGQATRRPSLSSSSKSSAADHWTPRLLVPSAALSFRATWTGGRLPSCAVGQPHAPPVIFLGCWRFRRLFLRLPPTQASDPAGLVFNTLTSGADSSGS